MRDRPCPRSRLAITARGGHDAPGVLRLEASDADTESLRMLAVHTDTMSIRRHFIPSQATRAIAGIRSWRPRGGTPGAAHPTGYAYSHFCERYRQWAGDPPHVCRSRAPLRCGRAAAPRGASDDKNLGEPAENRPIYAASRMSQLRKSYSAATDAAATKPGGFPRDCGSDNVVLEHPVSDVPGSEARQHLWVGGDFGVRETAIEMTLMGRGEHGVEAAIKEERHSIVR